MSINSFGRIFRFMTWGESHGPALGVVVDGCPSGLLLRAEDVQHWLDRRRPGQSRHTTQRREPDRVKILSGLFEDERTDGPRTTGTSLSLMIENVDQRSKDYSDIRDAFRPGHADFAYHLKYGVRDYRGGGRSSARETAARVAAGGVARIALSALAPSVQIRGALIQIGKDRIDPEAWDWAETEQNDFWCPDAAAAARWVDLMDATRKSGDSLGAVIEVRMSGVPAGLGAPVYGKLDQDLAAAMMSINAVKGVEIGDGFAAAALSGAENADEIRMGADGPEFLSNHAGGVLGGISTGQELVVRFAVKPTSSILTPRRTIDVTGRERELLTKGRHDPCVGIRAVPVGEAMAACVLLDHLLLHRGQLGENQGRIG
ncbi:MAG: chorismate synthase [Neomegalonema sp.]|nr:chorismate synthase [Neomegalonema sp.]